MAQYTIELSDPEANAVSKLAADTGRTPDQVVSLLIRTRLFAVAARNAELDEGGDENFQRAKKEQWEAIKRALTTTAPTLVYSRD